MASLRLRRDLVTGTYQQAVFVSSKVEFPIEVPDPWHLGKVFPLGEYKEVAFEGLKGKVEEFTTPRPATNDDPFGLNSLPIF